MRPATRSVGGVSDSMVPSNSTRTRGVGVGLGVGEGVGDGVGLVTAGEGADVFYDNFQAAEAK